MSETAAVLAGRSFRARASVPWGDLLVVGAVVSLFVVAFVLTPIRGTDGENELTFCGMSLPALCWFRRVTGLPCASCGLTRSVVLLVHGRWADSIAQHPFGIVAVGLALLQLPPRILSLSGRKPWWSTAWDRAWLRASLAALVLMIVYWMLRTGPAVLAALGGARMT